MKFPLALFILISLYTTYGWANSTETVYSAGHSSLSHWLLPEVSAPEDNKLTQPRVELGKKLFFDTRLSRDGNMSCATCHNPLYGWSDGLPTARGFKGLKLSRASPTIVNTAYNSIHMWDGRKSTLEHQALGPMEAKAEMNTDIPALISWLKSNKEYALAFKRAYPDEPLSKNTLAKAIASFERTIVSNNSPFDKWVKGSANALTKRELDGFKVFNNPNKGNCAVCHSAPNFTDDGFHNIGLASFGVENPDMGRHTQKPVSVLKGAFKTPTLRDVEYSAPYFHDGSAQTLEEVVDHYIKGGEVKSNIAPNMKPLKLSDEEKENLVLFLKSLSSPRTSFELPILPM